MASKTQDALKGGVTGASVGAVGGPWSAAIGGGLGAVGGYLGWMPGTGQGDGNDANNTISAMKAAGAKYDQYRPELMQARMNALNSALGAFSPVNAALGRMYGPDAQFDLSKAAVNPFALGSSANPGPAAAAPKPKSAWGESKGSGNKSQLTRTDDAKGMLNQMMPWSQVNDLRNGDYLGAAGGPVVHGIRDGVGAIRSLF